MEIEIGALNLVFIVLGFVIAVACVMLYRVEKKHDKLYHEHEALKVHAKYVKEVSEARGDKLDGMREAVKLLGLDVFVDLKPGGFATVNAEQRVDMRRLAEFSREEQGEILGHMVEHAKFQVADMLKDFIKGQLGH